MWGSSLETWWSPGACHQTGSRWRTPTPSSTDPGTTSRQLHRLVSDNIDHYNTHRPHRALEQQPLSPLPATEDERVPTADVIRFPRCDGLINEYKNAA